MLYWRQLTIWSLLPLAVWRWAQGQDFLADRAMALARETGTLKPHWGRPEAGGDGLCRPEPEASLGPLPPMAIGSSLTRRDCGCIIRACPDPGFNPS